jgi:hypothetical protein
MEPRMIVGETSAIVPDVFTQDAEGYRVAKHWRTIASSHITQFIDLPIPRNGQRRKK